MPVTLPSPQSLPGRRSRSRYSLGVAVDRLSWCGSALRATSPSVQPLPIAGRKKWWHTSKMILFSSVIAIGVPKHLVEPWPNPRSRVRCIELKHSTSSMSQRSGLKIAGSSPKILFICRPHVLNPMHVPPGIRKPWM